MSEFPFWIPHLIGAVFGAGGATAADIIFFHVLRDREISEDESRLLRKISNLIWIGFFILVFSGIGLFLPEKEELLESSKFLAKMTIVGVILLNGLYLNLKIAPQLNHPETLPRAITHAFLSGAVSIVSWYSALILGAYHDAPDLPYSSWLLFYGIFLFASIVFSWLISIRYQKSHV